MNPKVETATTIALAAASFLAMGSLSGGLAAFAQGGGEPNTIPACPDGSTFSKGMCQSNPVGQQINDGKPTCNADNSDCTICPVAGASINENGDCVRDVLVCNTGTLNPSTGFCESRPSRPVEG